MNYKSLGTSSVQVSEFILGTWAFGNDAWWGHQDDKDSFEVLSEAFAQGVRAFDTAPVYGKGHSEEIVGSFIVSRQIQRQSVIATKLGLRWNALGRIDHDLSRERMLKEIDESRQRLKIDVIDLYQVHWPDPKAPIRETAETMRTFYKEGLIRAIGVSNFSVEQMREFLRFSPLHCLQAPYNMFKRDLEKEIIPFCRERNIALIVYVPLCSGILTGKFFFGQKIPGDLCRKKHRELQRERFQVNKEAVAQLKEIADAYTKTLAQLVLCWTSMQDGITAVIAGARTKAQLLENAGGFGWQMTQEDRDAIEQILRDRSMRLEGSSAPTA